MLIGELARQTGVKPRLLRYYEKQGLLATERRPNGYRSFPDAAVTTVRQIRALLGAGLGTDAIREVLRCVRNEEAAVDLCPLLAQRLRAELATMDDRISALQQSRGALATYLAQAAD